MQNLATHFVHMFCTIIFHELDSCEVIKLLSQPFIFACVLLQWSPSCEILLFVCQMSRCNQDRFVKVILIVEHLIKLCQEIIIIDGVQTVGSTCYA